MLKSIVVWLIRKLGGVPIEEFNRAAETAQREASKAREMLRQLVECETRVKKAETALTTFIDRIEIDSDGQHRPAPMDFPMAHIDYDKRIDEAYEIITLRVTPRTVVYNVANGFGEPEGRLLYQIARASDVVGRAVAKSIKVAFGIEVAEMAALN